MGTKAGGAKMIWLILAASFILRLIAINQSLWLDEAIGAMAARDFSFFGILNNFPKFDNHPPLYYLLLKGETSLFGFSEISLRFPSIIFGVATVYFTYITARHFVGKKEKFFPNFCALLLATSPLHIYYSQEARMYAMAAFLAVVAVYSFLKEKWILFSFSLAVLVFSDYVPVFLLPVFWIIGFIDRKPKQWWGNLLLSHIPLMILGLFWLPIFLDRSGQ
ncbi:MAG: glycosyltransferase family 39 protein [Patescibacteria group bacterium]